MDPLVVALLVPVSIVVVIAVTAVVLIRLTISGTDSRHRAAVLSATAELIRAIRGRR